MQETGQPFDAALAATRAGNLFTTHTAVPAGFDRFSPALIEQYLGDYARNRLGHRICTICWRLGRQNPDDSSEPFNMAYLAIHGSGAVNGVSRLHGCVSRHIFAPLFPRWPEDEVPVGHVTNGVHMPTWDSDAGRRALDGVLRQGPLAGNDGDDRAEHPPHSGRAALAASHRRPRGPGRIRALPAVAAIGRLGRNAAR